MIRIHLNKTDPSSILVPLLGAGFGDKILIMAKCNREYIDNQTRYSLISNISNDNDIFDSPQFIDSVIGVDVSKVPGFPNVRYNHVIDFYRDKIPYTYEPFIFDHISDTKLEQKYFRDIFRISEGDRNAVDWFWNTNDLNGHTVVVCHVRRLAHGPHQELASTWWLTLARILEDAGAKCVFLVDTLYDSYSRMFDSYPVIPLVYGNTSITYIHAIINRSKFFVGTDTGISWMSLTTKTIPVIVLLKQWIGGVQDFNIELGTTVLAPNAMDTIPKNKINDLTPNRPRVRDLCLREVADFITYRI